MDKLAEKYSENSKTRNVANIIVNATIPSRDTLTDLRILYMNMYMLIKYMKDFKVKYFAIT